MYLYFLRVVFTVVKVVKVSSQSFSHCFIVICMCPTKATSRDAYTRAPSFLKNAKNAPQKERQDTTRDSRFSTTKKKQQLNSTRRAGRVPQNPENLSVSSRHLHATWCLISSDSLLSLCLSPLLSRVFFRTETMTMTFSSTTTTFRCRCFEKTPSLPSVRTRGRRRMNRRIIVRAVSEPTRSYYEEKEDYLHENNANNNAESASQTLKLSVQDRLRMGKNAHRFRSVVCLGTSPRAVGSGSEVLFVDGEDVYGVHDQYLPNKNTKNGGKKEVVSSELILQKSAFAVEMAVRKIRSTYFAATTWENRHYLVREERDPQDGSVMNLSIREAKLSERLRRRMENEQMSQFERMGRGFPILDV